jgi:hypothetical protein
MLKPWRRKWLVLLAAAVYRATLTEAVAVAADSLGSILLVTYSLAELEAQGRAVIHQPPSLAQDNGGGAVSGGASLNVPFMAQPFFVTVGVELQAGRDYAGWRLCQRVGSGNALLRQQPPLEHCSLLWVRDGTVSFSPVSGMSPPEYDFLVPGVYEAEAWFESGGSSGPYRSWGLTTRLFEAGPPPPRDAKGGFVYLDIDPADPAAAGSNDNVHAAFASIPLSPSVVGVIVEPRSFQPNLAYVIINVVTQLPAVRPIYLFHGPSFDPCATANAKVTGANATTVVAGGSVPNSAVQASAALLCGLVRSEQLVLYKLRVENFSFRDYNRFLTSKALWDHIGGDKVHVLGLTTECVP